MFPLYSTAKVRHPPVATSLLVALNLAGFAWQLAVAIGWGAQPLAAFMTEHALVPQRILSGYDREDQWWTLLTHMFLHGGFVHLAGNLWFLWVFGRSVEDRLGWFQFLFLYFASGVAAATLQVAVAPSSALPMIGASGAISGILGAYLILLPGEWILALVPWIVPIVPVPAFLFLIAWFALQAWGGIGALMNANVSAESGGIAWWAHAGGFLAGLGLVHWARRARWIRRRG